MIGFFTRTRIPECILKLSPAQLFTYLCEFFMTHSAAFKACAKFYNVKVVPIGDIASLPFGRYSEEITHALHFSPKDKTSGRLNAVAYPILGVFNQGFTVYHAPMDIVMMETCLPASEIAIEDIDEYVDNLVDNLYDENKRIAEYEELRSYTILPYDAFINWMLYDAANEMNAPELSNSKMIDWIQGPPDSIVFVSDELKESGDWRI